MLTIDPGRLQIRAGERCLDLGCGNGRHSFEAIKRAATVVACDLELDAVTYTTTMGEALARSAPCSPGSFGVVGDARRLPFPDASFDKVVAAEVLEHIDDDSAALREISRVLKPGGRVAISVPRTWPEAICWALSRPYHDKPGGHTRIYRRRQLEQRLARAGLAVAGVHHAHALHSPYWWIRCVVGPEKDDNVAVRVYRRLLERQIVRRSRVLDALERALDPVLGKSIVMYATKVSGSC